LVRGLVDPTDHFHERADRIAIARGLATIDIDNRYRLVPVGVTVLARP